jgi:hypothetical protein
MVCWFAAYGVIPVFIYGFASDRFQALLARARARADCSCCEREGGTSTGALSLPPVRSGIDSEFH